MGGETEMVFSELVFADILNYGWKFLVLIGAVALMFVVYKWYKSID